MNPNITQTLEMVNKDFKADFIKKKKKVWEFNGQLVQNEWTDRNQQINESS